MEKVTLDFWQHLFRCFDNNERLFHPWRGNVLFLLFLDRSLQTLATLGPLPQVVAVVLLHAIATCDVSDIK
jgi:hypothetical protein